MIHKMFSIRDAAADAFLPPFVLPKDDMAKRVFAQCINSEDHQFAQAPADYTLFKIASFDDETGEVDPLAAPASLGNGVNYVAITPGDPDAPVTPQPQLLNGSEGEHPTE